MGEMNFYRHDHHPLDSLYTIESVIDKVPVIECILGPKLRDSGKYFSCFLVFQITLVPYFSVGRLGTCPCVIF